MVAIIVALLAYLVWLNRQFDRKRKMSPTARCQADLKQIGLAIKMYEYDYDGVQPNSLTPIYPYINDPQVFLAPGSREKPGDLSDIDSWSDYRYVRPANRRGDPSIVAYMPPWNSRLRKGFVLLSDGRALTFSPEDKGSETFESFMLEHGL